MLSVFGDESYDESKERVFAVAGLVGSQEEWDRVTAIWMERTGGKVFHAADCESDVGDFSGIAHKDNILLYKDLAQIIAGSKLLGWGVGIDLSDFNSAFPDALPDYPYFMCFIRVVVECARVGYLSIPQEEVKFTFDNRLESEYHAGRLYDYMVNLPEWKLHSFLHSDIAFASRKTVPIQAADLLARETMKHRDNQIGPVLRPIRRSMAALANTKRFRFEYYQTGYFTDLKKRMDEFNLVARNIGDIGYAGWLSRNKIEDNRTNRLRYLIFIEEQERQIK